MRAFRVAKPFPSKFLTPSGLSDCPSLLHWGQLRKAASTFMLKCFKRSTWFRSFLLKGVIKSLGVSAYVGCNTLLSANFFRCLKLEFCGAGCEESHPRVRFWCWWCSDPKHDYGLHALCERGRQGRALARWNVRGKAGRSPGTVSEFAVSLNPLV